MNDLRVHQHNLCFGIFPCGHVHHRQPHALANLRRCQPHSLRRVHRHEHVFRQHFQLGVEFLDRRTGFLQHRVSILHDRIDRPRRGRGCRRCRFLHGGHWVRTRRFVGHNLRNSASFRRVNLLQIFAEKRLPIQVLPLLLRQHLPPAPRTNPIAHTRPVPVPSSPCPRYPSAYVALISVSRILESPRLGRLLSRLPALPPGLKPARISARLCRKKFRLALRSHTTPPPEFPRRSPPPSLLARSSGPAPASHPASHPIARANPIPPAHCVLLPQIRRRPCRPP